jgi:hypothetical protein
LKVIIETNSKIVKKDFDSWEIFWFRESEVPASILAFSGTQDKSESLNFNASLEFLRFRHSSDALKFKDSRLSCVPEKARIDAGSNSTHSRVSTR